MRKNLIFKKIVAVIFVCIWLFGIFNSNVSANTDEKDDKKPDGVVEITAEEERSFENKKLIDNYNYFYVNPKHGKHVTGEYENGTCTTTAMQMLLGYHNYYTDRRLIPETDGNGNRFLSDNYGIFEEHPDVRTTKNYSIYDESDPENIINTTNGRVSIGTERLVYEKLIDYAWGWFLEQSTYSIASAAREFIKNYAPSIKDNVQINVGSFNYAQAKAEIDAGRPIILVYSYSETGSFHVIPAYGYAKRDNADGFIVHLGYDAEDSYMWINQSSLAYQIRMVINHTHSYTSDVVYKSDVYVERTCSICNCNIVESIYEVNELGNTITGINYPLSSNITLPTIIKGKQITTIGEEAFRSNADIVEVTIPISIINIEKNAFKFCSRLEKVIILNNSSTLINLGDDVFYGCSLLEEIVVPNSRIVDYKNTIPWNVYRNIIISSEEIASYNISNLNLVSYVLYKSKNIIKLIVDSDNTYQIVGSSLNDCELTLYNGNMAVIDHSIEGYNGKQNIIRYLTSGIYYLTINIYNDESADSVTLTSGVAWSDAGNNILYDTEYSIINNLQQTEDGIIGSFRYINLEDDGFYNISIIATLLNGGISYPADTLLIKNSLNEQVIDKYNILNLSEYAGNDYGTNDLYVYLLEGAVYYINISLPIRNYTNVTLKIVKAEQSNIDLTNKEYTEFTENLISNNKKGDYVKSFTVNQILTYNFNVNVATGNNISVILFKNDGTGKFVDIVDAEQNFENYDIILEPGTYYIGYFGNVNSNMITISISNKINYTANRTTAMVADPGIGYTYGSEVRFNHGALNRNTITEGFTRHIHFVGEGYIPSTSRLDYYFSSSNENVAMVSEYGTVLAMPVNQDTEVTITAIYKDNIDLLYTITFLIRDEFETSAIDINIDLSFSYSETNGQYQLELTDDTSAYPYNIYYEWLVFSSNNANVSISEYGTIFTNREGSAVITGEYTLNSRVTIIINLTITE